MLNTELTQHLKEIEKNTKASFDEKDKQSLFYFIQMFDLMYNELCFEVYDQGLLYDIVHNTFKKNIIIIFDNMKSYAIKVSDNSRKSFNELIKVSTSNRYVALDNLNGLYQNFKLEVIKNLSIKNKIEALINANKDVLKGQLYSKCVVNDKNKTDEIINKYTNLLIEELEKNISSKRDLILSLYREFIDSILNEVYEQKERFNNQNLKLIINTSYNYLKEKEYINIDKYADLNIKFINESFNKIDGRIYNELGIRKNNTSNINPVKDYLLSFNNTIRVKVKNVFDEMNLIVTLDKEETKDKIKEFNDLITHIYEIRLVFDKQFLEYKKEFIFVTKDNDRFDEIFKKECSRLTEGIKTNISNIFRENIKIYNDVVYRTLLLKARVHEYNEVLSASKIKDLLFK
ncbi:MAG: hypothetical protein ACI31R_02690 [Bacilli bacterium]